MRESKIKKTILDITFIIEEEEVTKSHDLNDLILETDYIKIKVYGVEKNINESCRGEVFVSKKQIKYSHDDVVGEAKEKLLNDVLARIYLIANIYYRKGNR